MSTKLDEYRKKQELKQLIEPRHPHINIASGSVSVDWLPIGSTDKLIDMVNKVDDHLKKEAS